jgi:NAD-reducing hydrogenase small subunit
MSPPLRLALLGLTGCSGCQMAFLDLDEWLLELADRAQIVYCPLLLDQKTYPEAVDVCLVEGGVGNRANLEQALLLRRHTRTVVSYGDCAVSTNVPGLRNPLLHLTGGSAAAVLERSYRQLATLPGMPRTRESAPGAADAVPELLEQVLPLHAVIPVEVWLPGCPPPLPRLRALLESLLRGEPPPGAP